MKEINTVKINPDEIPDEVYEAGCRIIAKSIFAFFADENNRKACDEWKKTEEGKLANMTKEEREKSPN